MSNEVREEGISVKSQPGQDPKKEKEETWGE